MEKTPKEGKGQADQQLPLRLEWIEAGTLTENPLNWRKHSQEQLQTVRELLQDPEVGWWRSSVQRADQVPD